jgi:membrane associated rhomboid family serine protease
VNSFLAYISIAPVASAIFAITLVFSILAFYSEELYSRFILHPYSIAKGERVYTIITSGLIHKDFSHLFFNMFSYFFFAFQLEATIGHWQFGILYVASLILSDLPTVMKHKDDYWYHSLGASGAISAVVFSSILFNPMGTMYIMILPIPIPAILFGVLYLAYCVFASRRGIGNVNHDAHFYGAVCGIIITISLYPMVVPHFLHHLHF